MQHNLKTERVQVFCSSCAELGGADGSISCPQLIKNQNLMICKHNIGPFDLMKKTSFKF